ncbi:MAG: tetratricopeptide repeat protein [Calditrichaeota bacterium]|nr:tetratricopeptide repeat protein [Calditrichota bacterium]
MKRIFTIQLLLCWALFQSQLFSQTNFSEFVPGAASKALGGSAIAFPGDASVVMWNPAALTMMLSDQVLLNVNDRSQIDFLGFTRFFPPKIGIGVNILPHSVYFPNATVASLGMGYRLHSDFSVGGNFNISKSDTGSVGSSFSVGIFYRPSPRFQFQKQQQSWFWQFLHSSQIKDRVSFGLVFYNIPLAGKEKNHELRLGAAVRPFSYNYYFHLAWHIRNGGSNFFLGASTQLLKNVDLLVGMKDFNAKETTVGLSVRLFGTRLDFSYNDKNRMMNVSLGVIFGADEKTQAQQYRLLGTKLVKENDLFEGLKAYQKALVYDPVDETINLVVSVLQEKVNRQKKTIDSLFAIGQKFEEKGWYATAFQAYRQALNINPRHKKTLHHLKSLAPRLSNYLEDIFSKGVSLYEKNNINQAETMFSKILAVNANHAGAAKYMAKIDSIKTYTFSEYYYRGLGYYNQKRYKRAIEEFTRALALNPADKEAQRYKKSAQDRLQENKQRISKLLRDAKKFERQNLFVKANNRYRRILELDENNSYAREKVSYLHRYISAVVESKYQKARQLFNKGNWQGAIDAFTEILSIDPSHRGARNHLRRARNELNSALGKRYQQAKQYFNQKNYEKALEECNYILSVDANHAAAQTLQSQAYASISRQNLHEKGKQAFTKGDFLTARKIYREILAKEPNDKVAADYLKKCETKLKDRVEQLFNEGMVSYSEGDYHSAIQVWNKILAIDPNHKSTKEYIKKATERLDALNRIKEKD